MHKAQSLNEKQREQRQARRERHSPDDAIFWELGRLDEKVDRIDEKVERLDEKVDRLEIQVAKVYTHISDVRAELKSDIHRTEMQIASLRQELKEDNASLRQELKEDIHHAGWKQIVWISALLALFLAFSQVLPKLLGS